MDFEVSNIGIAATVAAGAVSFLSPCALPLVPGCVSYDAGNSSNRPEAAAPDRFGLPLLSLPRAGRVIQIAVGGIMILMGLPW